ncbi:DUF7336 domain-containing protein [Chitinimonas lacunae]|uniref:DUF7336 domain-containing protein n=1 Tax=Chitinimonas lacunae TaxID=1963018 RepID=A0ABV8MPA7_9NEIS
METVFLVNHIHPLPNEDEDVKFIGIYLTKQDAEEAVKRIKILPGFSEYPDRFHIEEYEIW